MRRAGALSICILVLLFSAACATGGRKSEKATEKALAQIKKERRAKEFAQAREDKVEPEAGLTADEYELRGDEFLRQGNYGLAFLQYSKAHALLPSGFRLRYKIGRLYIAKDLLPDALAHFESMLRDFPENALTYEGLGRVYMASGDLEKAEKNLEEAARRSPALWESYNLLGMISDRKKEFEKAEGHYSRAIALKPEEAALFNNMGISFYLAGKYENAAGAFSEAIRLSPRERTYNKTYNNLGLALAGLGRYSDALENFKKAAPEHIAYNKLGTIYFQEGKYEKAALAFEKALDLSPTFYADASQKLARSREALLGEDP